MSSGSSNNVLSNTSNCALNSIGNVIKEKIDSLNLIHFKETQEKLDSIKDSVLNYFESSVDSIFSDSNSAFMNNAIASHWYDYFEKSFDKLISSYTALVVAVLTVIGAIFVLKHWYDKRDFDKKIIEMQKDWEFNLSDLQEKTAQIDVELKKIRDIEKILQDKISKHDCAINSSITVKADDEWVRNEIMTVNVSYLFWQKMKDGNTSRDLLQTILGSIQNIRNHFSERNDEEDNYLKLFVEELYQKDVVNTLFAYVNDKENADFRTSIHEMSISLWKTIQRCNNPYINSKSLENFIFSSTQEDDEFNGMGLS